MNVLKNYKIKINLQLHVDQFWKDVKSKYERKSH
jgi:hypothetical protein